MSTANLSPNQKPVKNVGALEGPLCPLCNSRMALRTTTKFHYPNGSPRKFWGCSEWPACKGIHGAHPDGRPLGIPGDAETKKARQRAHAAFDELWKARCWSRSQGYAWLRERLGITRSECHIAMFDVTTCERVVAVCKEG